jgi:hypothetical protein
MVTISRTAEFAAPQSTVWRVSTDITAWPRYSPVRSVVIERPADNGIEGVGQIRAIRTWLGTVREEVTEFEPGRGFSYSLLSGAPVRDYRGSIALEPCAAGTRYRWDISFEATWHLAPLMTLMAKYIVSRTLRGLGRELAQGSSD